MESQSDWRFAPHLMENKVDELLHLLHLVRHVRKWKQHQPFHSPSRGYSLLRMALMSSSLSTESPGCWWMSATRSSVASAPRSNRVCNTSSKACACQPMVS